MPYPRSDTRTPFLLTATLQPAESDLFLCAKLVYSGGSRRGEVDNPNGSDDQETGGDVFPQHLLSALPLRRFRRVDPRLQAPHAAQPAVIIVSLPPEILRYLRMRQYQKPAPPPALSPQPPQHPPAIRILRTKNSRVKTAPRP